MTDIRSLTDRSRGKVMPFQESDKRCCEKAEKVVGGCVCRYLTVCPDHGTRCNGSHD